MLLIYFGSSLDTLISSNNYNTICFKCFLSSHIPQYVIADSHDVIFPVQRDWSIEAYILVKKAHSILCAFKERCTGAICLNITFLIVSVHEDLSESDINWWDKSLSGEVINISRVIKLSLSSHDIAPVNDPLALPVFLSGWRWSGEWWWTSGPFVVEGAFFKLSWPLDSS